MINKKLLTDKNRQDLPALYANENVKDPKAVVKFFTPDANATWYAFEFDGEDMFFGYVDLGLGAESAELGYFSLSELEKVRGKLGLPVERDLHFTPKSLDEIKQPSPERTVTSETRVGSLTLAELDRIIAKSHADSDADIPTVQEDTYDV